MFTELKETVLSENLKLVEYGLVTFTWGNVSQIDPSRKFIAIKPSGVPYEDMEPEDIVIVDRCGKVVDGNKKPSSDLNTHLAIYDSFDQVWGVVHTHSRWATIFAQMCEDIPCLGTTHADTFGGAVPCTDLMTAEEIAGDYERETGNAIVKCFKKRGLDPLTVKAVNVASHGPFVWGEDAEEAVHNAVVLEECAMMAWHTIQGGRKDSIQKELLEKHYFRKHGPGAYYGQ